MSDPDESMCPDCDRLLDRYTNAVERGDRAYAKTLLGVYQDHKAAHRGS